jgi:hypothetical protein
MDYITTVQTEDMAKTMSNKAKCLVIKTKRIRVCLKHLLKKGPYFSVVNVSTVHYEVKNYLCLDKEFVFASGDAHCPRQNGVYPRQETTEMFIMLSK